MKNKKFIVYYHKSPVNKYYIGITSYRPIQRWHLDGSGYKTQIKFWNAIKKYGWDSFEHKIVAENLTEEDACELEQKLIIKYDTFNNGYNSDWGGKGSQGHFVTTEAKQKMRDIKLGTHLNPTTLKSVRERRYESRMQIEIYDLNKQLLYQCKGYQEAANILNIKRSTLVNACNYETLCLNKYIIINEKNKARKDIILNNIVDKYINKVPTIIQYDLQGNKIATFMTFAEASKNTGFPMGSISKVCSGFELTYKNFIFLKAATETIEERLIKIANKEKRSYKCYKIVQYDLFNNIIAEFFSFKEAALKTQIDETNLRNSCKYQIIIDNKYKFKKVLYKIKN